MVYAIQLETLSVDSVVDGAIVYGVINEDGCLVDSSIINIRVGGREAWSRGMGGVGVPRPRGMWHERGTFIHWKRKEVKSTNYIMHD